MPSVARVIWCVVLWVAVAYVAMANMARGADVRFSRMDGTDGEGRLVAVDAERVTLNVGGTEQQIAVESLADLKLDAPPVIPETVVRVQLVDGSEVIAASVVLRDDRVQLQGGLWDGTSFELSLVRWVQLANDERLVAGWRQRLEKDSRQDQLIIIKKDVLDRLEGVVGVVDAENVNFTFDGEVAAIARKRVYGMIFATRPAATARPTVKATLADGSVLMATQATLAEGRWSVSLAAGPVLALPEGHWTLLDWGTTRRVYLSQLTPREVRYTPCPKLGNEFFRYDFQRDLDFERGPLRLGHRKYDRGLAIHSKTVLRYRLGGEYRRLQTLAGMDDQVKLQSALSLSIRGDGKPLYEADFVLKKPPTAAQILDLDVAGVDELEIVVDFGADGDGIGDRLHLADAKLIR